MAARGEVRASLEEFVRGGRIAGAVFLVTGPGGERIVTAGYRDLAAPAPMRPDTVFQVMSMTKPVTAAAVMILSGEGRLRLDDPVSNYLPEFGRRSDDGRNITVRQLLTHTSGLPAEDPAGVAEDRTKLSHTLAEVAGMVVAEPLAHAPGEQYLYSGPGFAVLGRVVEVVSGIPFQDFVVGRLLGPLGMRSTWFFPPRAVRDRMAQVYQYRNGRLEVADVDRYRAGAKYANPAGGLFSTAGDLARFMRMMLHGGVLDGRRILPAESVAAMTARQATPQPVGRCAPGMALGWQLPSWEPACARPFGPGAYGHSGAFGTYMWADPARGEAGVFLIQRIGGGNRERDVTIAAYRRGGRQ